MLSTQQNTSRRNHLNNSYRPDIDGLRAIAVLSVILCHAKLFLPGGYVGVDIFFVISGYLIISRIIEAHCQNRFSVLDFWTRRIRRLFFPYAAVLSFTLIVGYFILWPGDYKSLAYSSISTLTLSSNIYFWMDSGYFSTASETKPLLHTWSLSIEEQFYFFFPLLVIASGITPRRITITLTAITSVSFLLCIYCSYFHRSANFYLLPTRFWELGIGGLIGSVSLLKKIPLERFWLPTISSASIFLIAPLFLFDDTTRFPGISAIPPTLATALIILIGNSDQNSKLTRFLSYKPLVFIGKISYSLYLWHWPVFAFANYSLSNNILPSNTGLNTLLLLLMIFILAILTHLGIESPIRSQRILNSSKTLLATFGITIVFLFFFSLLVFYTNGFETRLTPALKRIQLTATRDSRWHAETSLQHIKKGKLTSLGSPEHPQKLLVWGDSHAMAVLPALNDICFKKGFSGVAATHSSTPPILDYYTVDPYGLNQENLEFSKTLIDFAREKQIKNVLLVSTWNILHRDPASYEKLVTTVQTLKENGSAVYILRTVPTYTFNIPKALISRHFYRQDITDIRLTTVEYNNQYPFPKKGQDLRDAGATILDPAPYLRSKDGNFYPYSVEGCFYYDNHHLSSFGAMQLLPLFDEIGP